MSATDDLLGWFEVHSVEGIRKALAAGASPVEPISSKRPIECLIEMYLRSPRFADCLRVMLEAGATIADPLLQAILLDDDASLRRFLQASPNALHGRFQMDCAYTRLKGVSALHICAEYNSVRCARVLLDSGLDVNVRAHLDGEGIGGQTPIFHCVNSNQNHCRPIMELLTESGANLDIRLKGLVWGGGFDWETCLFDVTPISYAQCGLYFQFHRPERQVYSNIDYLYRKRYGSPPQIPNLPNKYLQDDKVYPPRT